MRASRLFSVLVCLPVTSSWIVSPLTQAHAFTKSLSGIRLSSKSEQSIDFDSLLTMDVVIYSEINDGSAHKRVGAIQENGRLTPLSVWSTEPAFGESLELLVDEDDMVPGLGADDVVIHSIIPEDSLSYGSRQVGGGKGPGNPHGEESELLYYVDQVLLEGIKLTVRPELEITW